MQTSALHSEIEHSYSLSTKILHFLLLALSLRESTPCVWRSQDQTKSFPYLRISLKGERSSARILYGIIKILSKCTRIQSRRKAQPNTPSCSFVDIDITCWARSFSQLCLLTANGRIKTKSVLNKSNVWYLSICYRHSLDFEHALDVKRGRKKNSFDVCFLCSCMSTTRPVLDLDQSCISTTHSGLRRRSIRAKSQPSGSAPTMAICPCNIHLGVLAASTP